ncbi:MAG: toll/interleukin-1 receptor domain-containing protein, partial [Verrucomicrobia bacterium]|nr:toll/interleukin-1 receptor domain-containing protein [Verrucomicrobiota bacterium]
MPQDQVFISYSHKDRDFLEDLETSLKPYLRHGSVKSWSDERITPGSKWLPQITSALINTKVAVLLVSPDFIASDFIYEQELGPLLKAAEQGGVKILWVPVRASGYKKTGLKDIQAVLDPAQPLANMTNAERDQAWVKICEEIEKAVEDFTELDLSEAGQAIAWECLRNNFWPEPISLTAAIQAIRDEDVDRRNRIAATVFMQAPGQLASYVPEPMTEERARKLLDNLTNRDLLQSLSNGTMKIATSSNALIWGSYYQLDRLGNERALWENLVTNARQKLQEAGTKEDRNRIVDFILAVRSTGERNAERLKIPHALLDELGELASCQPFTEVQECFANFVRRWAVPEGIGPLEQTAARQGSSVRITKRNGRVIRLESINGSGALVPRIELSYLRSESSPPEQQTECRLEFSYDESGNVSWEEASDPVGRLLYRCAYSPAPPSAQVAPGQHQTTARYFIDNSDVASPRTRSGASFVRITRDAKGFDQRWEYLDGLGRPQPDELSRFGQEAENGDLGLPIRLTCLGPDLTPAVCSPGYAMADFTYDERGNKTSQSYFDIAAKPVTQSEGYHKATFSWDTRGNWIGVRLFGLNGESIIHTDGFAGW